MFQLEITFKDLINRKNESINQIFKQSNLSHSNMSLHLPYLVDLVYILLIDEMLIGFIRLEISIFLV